MPSIFKDRRALLGFGALVFGCLLMALAGTGVLHYLVSPQPRHEVKVQFANSKQLHKGDDVRIDGIAAGKVGDIKSSGGGNQSTVTLNVNNDATKLYRDATAVVRWKTVLGGDFYVDLAPGSPDAGSLGSQTIPVSRTSSQVELDDITSVLQPNAVRGLHTLPGELTKALSNPAQPGRLLNAVADISPDAQAGLGALRGQVPDRDLRQLISATATTVKAIDRPDDRTRKLISGAAATLGTTGRRAADLQATIAKSPSVMRDSDTTLTQLQGTLALANPLLAKLRVPSGQVAPTLAHLNPTLTGANRLLHRAEPLLHSLRPAAASLAKVAKAGLPLIRGLEPSLDRTQKTILPMLSEKDPQTTKSTAVMIGGTFEGLASGAGGQMDVNGHFIRFPATSGNSPLYSAPCQIYFGNPDAAQILACQTLQQAMKTYLNYSPLGPTPGTQPPAPAASTSRRAGR